MFPHRSAARGGAGQRSAPAERSLEGDQSGFGGDAPGQCASREIACRGSRPRTCQDPRGCGLMPCSFGGRDYCPAVLGVRCIALQFSGCDVLPGSFRGTHYCPAVSGAPGQYRPGRQVSGARRRPFLVPKAALSRQIRLKQIRWTGRAQVQQKSVPGFQGAGSVSARAAGGW